ncbi:27051_t:CDS:1, partial [Dentiscutata erythropus]
LKQFEIKGSLEVKGIVCNEAFKNLCNNPVITILKLNQGQIDSEGMKTLIEAIKKNTLFDFFISLSKSA